MGLEGERAHHRSWLSGRWKGTPFSVRKSMQGHNQTTESYPYLFKSKMPVTRLILSLFSDTPDSSGDKTHNSSCNPPTVYYVRPIYVIPNVSFILLLDVLFPGWARRDTVCSKKSVNKVLYNESIDEAIGNFVDIGTQREIGQFFHLCFSIPSACWDRNYMFSRWRITAVPSS